MWSSDRAPGQGALPERPGFSEGPRAPASRWPFRRAAVILAVTSFAAGIPTPLYPIYEHDFGFGSESLGLVFAAYTVGVFVTMFFVAPLSDRVGHRPILAIGMLLTGVAGAVFLAASGVAALALARAVSGLGVGATTSTATAAMAGLEPRADQHHVARVAVAANFGGVAVGVLVSGTLVEYAPAPTELVFVVLLVLSAVGLLLVFASPETVAPDVHRGAGRSRIQRIVVPASIRGAFWIAVGALAACYSIYGLFGALAPSYLRFDLGVGNVAVASGVIALMFGTAALAQLGLGQVRDRKALLLGLPLLLVGLALFVAATFSRSEAALGAGAAVIGLGVGFAFMGSVTLADRVAPPELRGEVLSGFYLGGYLALAVPTIGVAAGAAIVGLGNAGLAFGVLLGGFVAVLYLVLRRTTTPAGGEGRARLSS